MHFIDISAKIQPKIWA